MRPMIRIGLFVRGTLGSAATVIVTAIIALGASGCTTNKTQSNSAQSLARQGRELTNAEEFQLDAALEVLVKKCANEAGFPYWVGPVASVTERKGWGYVLDDVAWAKKHGYGGQFKQQAEKLRLNDRNIAYANTLPHKERIRYINVLDGGPSGGMLSTELPSGGTLRTPREGCRAKAKGQLYGNFETWFRVESISTNLNPLYLPYLVRDEDFIQGLRDWSSCMREKGYDYASPSDIRTELPQLTKDLSKGEAHSVEVEIAVDEAMCARVTSFAETARTLEGEYRDKWTHRYREDTSLYQHMRLAGLTQAKVIAAEYPNVRNQA
ncbi:hypothetical protein [Streptomyces sp. NPDC018947]|uniref:hypothetical protein n=1 Tax=Streptomyces sp. NPDC018947 TaxID=3365054 RepID=UPI0037B45C9C